MKTERGKMKRGIQRGTGCGLSGKEEEGHCLPLTQAWLGPIPLILDTKENEREE